MSGEMFFFVSRIVYPFRLQINALVGRTFARQPVDLFQLDEFELLHVLVGVQINLYPGTIYIEYPRYIKKISPFIMYIIDFFNIYEQQT